MRLAETFRTRGLVIVLARRKLHLGLSVRHEHEDEILGEAV